MNADLAEQAATNSMLLVDGWCLGAGAHDEHHRLFRAQAGAAARATGSRTPLILRAPCCRARAVDQCGQAASKTQGTDFACDARREGWRRRPQDRKGWGAPRPSSAVCAQLRPRGGGTHNLVLSKPNEALPSGIMPTNVSVEVYMREGPSPTLFHVQFSSN
jgi:hypothetical protein